MSAENQPTEPDPFRETLAPLPTNSKSSSPTEAKMPEEVEVAPRVMEPEKVLPPESELEEEPVLVEREGDLKLSSPEPSRLPRWKFWKRPSKRDMQMETLRRGASEMVGLMRSIKFHLEDESREREGIRKTLSPLPVAVESLKSMSESQAHTGRMLGELKTTMERSAEKDVHLIKSLNRIGNTMSNVDETFNLMDRTLSGFDQSNRGAIETMKQLGQRVEDSDRFMEETFARLRDAEREFTDYVSRTTRRGSWAMMALCSILLMSVVAVGFMFKENRELITAVHAKGTPVVHMPVRDREQADRVALLEELGEVDNGIGEPDRELVGVEGHSDIPAGEAEGEQVGKEGTLLSVNKLPRRK